MSGERTPIRVMVVDDSAVVRQLLKTLLERDGDLEVTTAADPIIARGKLARSAADVLVLDLEMPRMDGLRFLREIMAERPMPVVICSSHVARGTRQALEAMALGAVDIIVKPEMRVREFLEESRITISDVIRAAACARLPVRPAADGGSSLWRESRSRTAAAPVKPGGASAATGEPVVAIGASTGGPGAIATLLGALGRESPPILVVQHMPRSFTAPFAQHLDRRVEVEVREAVGGDLLRRNLVLVAPGGRHMLLEPHDHGYRVQLLDGPLVSRHRPSVDVLFGSVADHGPAGSAGVILTGMGDDGVEGLLRMRTRGLTTVAQERSSCAVFGMPREALARGAAACELSLPQIAELIGKLATDASEPKPSARRRRATSAAGAGGKTLDP